jgi:CHAT domain-containing protein
MEGPANLALAFLEAGAPVVVGALWNVPDDEPSLQSLVRSFHLRIGKGEDPVDALRNVQLERIRSGNSPESLFSWTAFEAFTA